MKDAKQELEQEFLKLPTLKHVGLALMQYAQSIFNNGNVHKDLLGNFSVGCGCVAFQFPKGEERIIVMFPRANAEIIIKEPHEKEITSLMPPKITHQMVLKNNQAGVACFEITDASILGQAAIYIKKVKGNDMSTRLIPPERADVN
jgi:hypothetical protein